MDVGAAFIVVKFALNLGAISPDTNVHIEGFKHQSWFI